MTDSTTSPAVDRTSAALAVPATMVRRAPSARAPLFCAVVMVTLAIPRIPLSAQGGPAPRPLGSMVATAAITFSGRGQIVPESDGHVFVADAFNRTTWRLDASLGNPTLVLDSVAGRPNTFSANSFLSPFRGDSALFYDEQAAALVVIDPVGKISRVIAPPPAPDRMSFMMFGYEYGLPSTSPTLGLVFKMGVAITHPPPNAPPEARVVDSISVIRMDVTTRATDTVARISGGREYLRPVDADGRTTSILAPMPFPFYDDAVVTTDGAIAIFHAREYRLEWIDPDGTRSAGSRIPYAWQKITDADRVRLIDSVNAPKHHAYDSVVAKRAADSVRTGAGPMAKSTTVNAEGEYVTRPVPAPAPKQPILAIPADIPDFLPPTGQHAVLADADNHVWIHVRQAPSGMRDDNLWEVVDRHNLIVDRIIAPDGATVAGFAPGFVYLVRHDAGASKLEKWRIR